MSKFASYLGIGIATVLTISLVACTPEMTQFEIAQDAASNCVDDPMFDISFKAQLDASLDESRKSELCDIMREWTRDELVREFQKRPALAKSISGGHITESDLRDITSLTQTIVKRGMSSGELETLVQSASRKY